MGSIIKRKWRRWDTRERLVVSATGTIYNIKCIYSSRNNESSKTFKYLKNELMLVVLGLFKNSSSHIFSVCIHFFKVKVVLVDHLYSAQRFSCVPGFVFNGKK